MDEVLRSTKLDKAVRALVAVAAVGLAAACDALMGDMIEVPSEAREQVVRHATVLYEDDLWTNGSDSYQTVILVLDLGKSNANDAINEELNILKKEGWSTYDRKSLTGIGVSSQQVEATAVIRSVDEYLAAKHSLEKSTARHIRRNYSNVPGAIVVAMNPLTS